MKWHTSIYYLPCVVLFLLPACGGSSYMPPPQATIQPQPMAPGYQMGPGMQQNFEMMRDNMGQVYGTMGQGGMSQEHYDHMMGMMGQMGGMMEEMGSPYYNQEMEQHHRQQLQEIHRYLSK